METRRKVALEKTCDKGFERLRRKKLEKMLSEFNRKGGR